MVYQTLLPWPRNCISVCASFAISQKIVLQITRLSKESFCIAYLCFLILESLTQQSLILLTCQSLLEVNGEEGSSLITASFHWFKKMLTRNAVDQPKRWRRGKLVQPPHSLSHCRTSWRGFQEYCSLRGWISEETIHALRILWDILLRLISATRPLSLFSLQSQRHWSRSELL